MNSASNELDIELRVAVDQDASYRPCGTDDSTVRAHDDTIRSVVSFDRSNLNVGGTVKDSRKDVASIPIRVSERVPDPDFAARIAI